jgi:hypothetical protein
VGIPVDLSGQIPFAHAVRDISTRGFSENRMVQRSLGLSQALLTGASAARHQLSAHQHAGRIALLQANRAKISHSHMSPDVAIGVAQI